MSAFKALKIIGVRTAETEFIKLISNEHRHSEAHLERLCGAMGWLAPTFVGVAISQMHIIL